MVYLILFVVFAGIGGAAYMVIDVYGDTVEEIRKRQAGTEETSMADVCVALPPSIVLVLRLLAAIVLGTIGWMVFLPLIALIFAVVGFFLPSVLIKKLRAKRIKLIETQLVEGLELLGNTLKSGMTLQQGVELLVQEFPPPISQEFRIVLAENRLGIDFVEALQNMANRLNSTIVHIMATGVAVTKRCGGDMTVIFGNIASTIREQAQIEGKLDAVTAQGRFQGLILSVMPFALILILWFIDRAHVETLFAYKVGVMAFGAVIVMVILAQAWINKLLKLDV